MDSFPVLQLKLVAKKSKCNLIFYPFAPIAYHLIWWIVNLIATDSPCLSNRKSQSLYHSSRLVSNGEPVQNANINPDFVIRICKRRWFFFFLIWHHFLAFIHHYTFTCLFNENQHHYEYNLLFSLHLSCPAALLTI